MWPDAKVIRPEHVFEVRVMDGRIHLTVKERIRDHNDGELA